MPLIILGLILIIGIIVYWYFGGGGDDEPVDTRPVRERYSHAFEDKADKAKDAVKEAANDVTKAIRKRAGIYDADYDVEDDGYGNRGKSAVRHSGDSKNADSDNIIPFPSDVEREKRRRGIDR